jgi:hypothetical protein
VLRWHGRFIGRDSYLESTGQTPQSPEGKPAIALAWVVELVIQALSLLDD